MMDTKYTKPIDMYLEPLYGMYGEEYTMEEYEALLTNHLKYVKRTNEEFKKLHKNAEEIRIRILIEADYQCVTNDCKLIGREPLPEEECRKIDNREQKMKEAQERVEKQKLEELLKKYPDYNKRLQ